MFYFKDDEKITVYFANGDIAVCEANDKHFSKIYNLCLTSNFEDIKSYIQPIQTLLNSIGVTFEITEDSKAIINGVEIENDNTAIIDIIKLLKDRGVIDKDIEIIKPFLLNLVANPFGNKAIELYDFIKNADYEITEDGCFLAYKHVNRNFKTRNNFENPIGEWVEETDYDIDRTNLCSKGLHFCAKSYGETHGNDGHWLIVKINPKDVIAITPDCNGTKGRAKGYFIVGEISKNDTFDTLDVEEMFEDIELIKENRIEQTIRLLKQYNNNKEKVAKEMGISVATVERNIRRYNSK